MASKKKGEEEGTDGRGPVEKDVEVKGTGAEVVKADEFAVPELPARLRPVVKQKKARAVLTEDEYTEALEKVIVRDFFPDLARLKAQNDLLDAVRSGDSLRASEAERRIRNAINASATPGSVFNDSVRRGTPSVSEWGDTPQATGPNYAESETVSVDVTDRVSSLDDFHGKFTSEDNQSFEEILEKDQEKRKGKAWWLHRTEEEHKEREKLRIENEKKSEQGGYLDIISAAGDGRRSSQHNWKYEAKNRLMYYPNGAPSTLQEYEELTSRPKKEIMHSSTRFRPEFLQRFSSPSSSTNVTPLYGANAVSEKSSELSSLGKVHYNAQTSGDDYRPVPSSPSIADVTASPLITWGNVAATPERIQGEGDNHSFKMQKVRRREEIALKLEKKSKKAKTRDSVYRTTPRQTPGSTPGSFSRPRSVRGSMGGSTPSLSDAASRLANRISTPVHSDSQLRKSYTKQ